jgi:hypothetical protein
MKRNDKVFCVIQYGGIKWYSGNTVILHLKMLLMGIRIIETYNT